MRSPRALSLLIVLAAFLLSHSFTHAASGAPARKPLEKVKMTVPAKSLTFFPYYLGKDKRIFEEEGIDLELIVIRPPLGITALQAGELDYSAAAGLGMRAALRGAPLRALMFIQTRLSFTLAGQPGMTGQKEGPFVVYEIGTRDASGQAKVFARE